MITQIEAGGQFKQIKIPSEFLQQFVGKYKKPEFIELEFLASAACWNVTYCQRPGIQSTDRLAEMAG